MTVTVARSPLRVSLFGGGSDLPEFFDEEQGTVLSGAINRFVDVLVEVPSRPSGITVRTDFVAEFTCPEQVRHEMIRECLTFTGQSGPLDISVRSDTRSTGSGLGSSGALITATLAALASLSGTELQAERLALDATKVELDQCGRRVGLQDQFTSAFGGLNAIRFSSGRKIDVQPIVVPDPAREALQSRLILVDTGVSRDSGAVLSRQHFRRGRREVLRRLALLASEMSAELESGNLDVLSLGFQEAWHLKRLLDPVPDPSIDQLYRAGVENGATGGKVLGAGSGGHMLFYVPEKGERRFRNALSKRVLGTVAFEGQGTRLLNVK